MRITPTTRICVGALFMVAWSAGAGTFSADFNSGPPANAKIYGSANVDDKEGVNNSGVLKLTAARASQLGSFVLPPLDGSTTRVASFDVTFKLLIGNGTGADGLTFCHHPTFPDEAFGGAVTDGGLTIIFDTYKNNPSEAAPAIRVYANKEQAGVYPLADLRKHKFVDVSISLAEDGNLNLSYDHQVIFTNLQVGIIRENRRFAFCARTGGRDDEHFIDDLVIKTRQTSNTFVQNYEPVGENVSPSPKIMLTLRDQSPRVNTGTIRLKLDGKEVVPVVEASNMKVQISHDPEKLLLPGSEHTVELAFADEGPSGKTNVFTYGFVVTTQVQVSE